MQYSIYKTSNWKETQWWEWVYISIYLISKELILKSFIHFCCCLVQCVKKRWKWWWSYSETINEVTFSQNCTHTTSPHKTRMKQTGWCPARHSFNYYHPLLEIMDNFVSHHSPGSLHLSYLCWSLLHSVILHSQANSLSHCTSHVF